MTSMAGETVENNTTTDKGNDGSIIATLSRSGLINIPKTIREKMGIINKTQKVRIETPGDGTIVIQLLDLVPIQNR